MPDENLNAFEQWMVKQNIEDAKTEGFDVIVARLRANGYNNVAAAVAAANPRSHTCVVVVSHDPDGDIADDTDMIRCGNPVEREHGGWPMCTEHIAMFQPTEEFTVLHETVTRATFFPNGQCPACGNGLDDEHHCQNPECSKYLRPELLEQIGYLCIQGYPNRICSGCTSACREPVFAYRESQTDN